MKQTRLRRRKVSQSSGLWLRRRNRSGGLARSRGLRYRLTSGAAAGLGRALCAALLAVILIGQPNRPGVAAPQRTAPVTQPGLRGPQPFATILCKFADVPDEPEPPSYFEQLLGSAHPGLDHYWREVSYGAISLAGSRVTGWHTLPHPQASYLIGAPNAPLPTAQSSVDLQRLTEDCVAAAGNTSAWSRYVGLNLVFNANLDRPRGTEICLELKDASKCFRTAWFWPDWYHNQSFWAHEMGHAFGLQHSFVGNGNGYGNMWDVMSVDGPCRTEPNYGRIGQHPIAFQKDVLGWIPTNRIFVAAPDSQATITLEQTAAPVGGGYLLARIPIRTDQGERGSGRMGEERRYYTVEARRRAGYDASLPGDGIIIHEVNLEDEPQARLVSSAHGRIATNLTTGAAARWLPGELFRDAEHGIAVSVDRAMSTGFVVTIYTRPPPAALLASENEESVAEDVATALFSAQQHGNRVQPIALAAENYIYALWMEIQTEAADGFISTGSSRVDIYASRRLKDGDWEPAIRISGDDRSSRSNSALAVDRRGNAYATWVDYRDGNAAVYAATRAVGGMWGKNVRLNDGSASGYTGLTIIVDWDDNVHILWEGLDRCDGDEVILHGSE